MVQLNPLALSVFLLLLVAAEPIQMGMDQSYQLTEGIIHRCQLPEHVGDRWRDLARALGYDQAAIEAIQKEQGSSRKECCIAILVRWIGWGGLNATAGKLAEALVKIELKNVAEKLICLDTNQVGLQTYISTKRDK